MQNLQKISGFPLLHRRYSGSPQRCQTMQTIHAANTPHSRKHRFLQYLPPERLSISECYYSTIYQ